MTFDAPTITALTATLAPIGAAIAYVFKRHDNSIKEIKLELAEHKKELDACRDREVAGTERRALQRTVIEMFWQELERLSPGSSILNRAKYLMDKIKEGVN